MDAQPDDQRAEGVRREVGALGTLGFDVEEIDLRSFFDEKGDLQTVLAAYDVLWLKGGNVFMLRYALARSGADMAITGLLQQDAIVYAGYSAGPCVLGPTLHGLDAVDPPDVVTVLYGEPPIWEGLAVLDYAIVPHVDSPEHQATNQLALVAANYRAQGKPYRTLRDGQVLVIDGDQETLCD